MKKFIVALVIVAIGLSVATWNYNHCIKGIQYESVVDWKEEGGRYYAELGSGTLEKVRYSEYYKHDIRTFVYDVRICDGEIKSRSVNNFFTYRMP